jgi:hypothetical protein
MFASYAMWLLIIYVLLSVRGVEHVQMGCLGNIANGVVVIANGIVVSFAATVDRVVSGIGIITRGIRFSWIEGRTTAERYSKGCQTL